MFKYGDEVEIINNCLSCYGVDKGCRGTVESKIINSDNFASVKWNIEEKYNILYCPVKYLKKVSE